MLDIIGPAGPHYPHNIMYLDQIFCYRTKWTVQFFSDRDETRAFATGEFNDKGLNDDS